MSFENDLPNLTWTTREEVAAQLAHFLASTQPVLDAETSPRVRATELLSILKAPSQMDCLRALALEAQAETEVRRAALRGLARLKAGVTGQELSRLLAEESLQEDDQWFGPHDLLILARQPDAQDAALHYLRGLTPEERSQVLQDAYFDTPAPLREWMYAQWLNEDRHLLAADRGPHSSNAGVISMTGEHTESRAVVIEMWREASGTERRQLLTLFLGLFNDDEEPNWSVLDELTAAETSELAEVLALPVGSLLVEWGPEHLFQFLNRQLIAEHERKLIEPRLRKVIEDETGMFLRALRVLRNWRNPAVDDWLSERAVGSELCEEVRSWMMIELWGRNRVQFSKTLVSALESGDHRLARQFIRWTNFGPREADRPAFRTAVGTNCSSEIQYYALRGLDCLGETGAGWEDRLAAWTQHVEPRLRIRALGALARRGDVAAREALLDCAEGPDPLPERAEAIAVLGELDAAAFRPLLTRVLAREEQIGERPSCAPGAEEAALALARLSTPEALTALVRSYLSAETRYLRNALDDYLTALVDADPAAALDLTLPRPGNWHDLIRTSWRELDCPP